MIAAPFTAVEKKPAVSYTSFKTMKSYLSILAAVLTLAVMVAPLNCRSPNQGNDARDRAAIVDQLFLREPNPAFIAGATRILESCGFKVDLWQGGDITVDFYRKLPSLGYRFIVLRVHSGLLLSLEEGKVIPLNTTYLFTAENYTTTRYVTEQLTDKVSNAMMEENYPLVFAVNSEFIKDARGNFDHTVVLAMGCESYHYDDMPAAFVAKGASVYVGWSDVVSLEYVDKAMLDLLENLCTENMTLAQGVSRTMADLGNDPYFDSYLRYSPSESGNMTVKELIR
jgi:hypothetical protein